jgi:hypothetical protein
MVDPVGVEGEPELSSQEREDMEQSHGVRPSADGDEEHVWPRTLQENAAREREEGRGVRALHVSSNSLQKTMTRPTASAPGRCSSTG